MGTFSTGGIAAEMAKFDGLSKRVDEACGKAVKAGGKLLAERLAAAAPVHTGGRKDVHPGALRDSIKAGKVEYNAGDGYHCTVRPEGNDHGEPLAKIGNILEYGRSNMAAQPWFAPTVDASGTEVIGLMRQTFQAETAKAKG